MSTTQYLMRNTLGAVDDMVLRLKANAVKSLPPQGMVRFEICMSEALANIAKHAKTTTPDAFVDIVLTDLATSLMVEIFDPQGAEFFDLRDHAIDLETLDPLSESGRGLGLILQCADTFDYGTSNGRTRMTLKFNR